MDANNFVGKIGNYYVVYTNGMFRGAFGNEQQAEQDFNTRTGLNNTPSNGNAPLNPQATAPGGPGQPSSLQNWLQSFLDAQAQSNGVYNQEQNTKDYGSLASDLLKTAASLRGPADYAQFMQFTGGGRNLLDQLYGQPRPAFSAPTQPLQPMTLTTLMQQMGMLQPGMPSLGGPAQ